MTALPERVRALAEAAELSAGRAEPEIVDVAAGVAARASKRLAFSGDWTVVALAGATGSGKSSLFNAITGTQLATTGVRRPTTAETMAAVWGTDMPHDLLDWLDVGRRQLIPAPRNDYANLVLLDLPDHDSTEESHRMQVDRLVELVDMMVWVVDPQKYADAALHHGYLRPLAQHAEVMLILLNQTDRLSPAEVDRCLTDLRRLTREDGLRDVEILGASAATGDGVPQLGGRILAAVKAKRMAAARLAADVREAATRLAGELGATEPSALDRRVGRDLTESLVGAAGGEVVVEAVGDSWRRRGSLATGWPLVSWIQAIRIDPLQRLRLGHNRVQAVEAESSDPHREVSLLRTSLPGAGPVQAAKVDAAIRRLTDQAAVGLPRGWADAVRDAARSNRPLLADRLDQAVAGTDLGTAHGAAWWALVRALQWLLIAALIAGLGWLAADFVLAYFQLPPLPQATWWGWPAPTLLAVGAAVAGLVLAGLSRIGVAVGARRKAVRARVALRKSIAKVAATEIVAPVTAELDRYDRARTAVRTAQG